MDSLALQEMRSRYLEKLYELSEGGLHDEVDIGKLQSELGYSREEMKSIYRYLSDEGWIDNKCRVMCIRITTRGINEVEAVMQQAYAEKMRTVLEKIYEMSGPLHTNDVNYFELKQTLGMTGNELNPILKDFRERRGWLGDSSDECVCLSPEGVLEVENSRVERRGYGGDVYQTNIHAPIYGGVHQQLGGQNNTQTSTVSFHAEFEGAINQLLAEIERAESLPQLHKIKVKGDIQTVKELAQLEKTPEVIQEAETRIGAIQSVLSTTTDMVSLGMVVIPIIRAMFGL